MTPFYAGLNRTMYYTLCRVAERAGLAHKEPRRLITNPEFWAEFCARVVDVNIKPGKSVAKIQKALFKICHEIVKTRYTQTDPDNIRHADLTALFMFNFCNAMGLLPMTQFVGNLSACRRLGWAGSGKNRCRSVSFYVHCEVAQRISLGTT